jgi:hypothetical protein
LEYSLGLLLDLRLNSTVNCCGLHNHNVLHTQHAVKEFFHTTSAISGSRPWTLHQDRFYRESAALRRSAVVVRDAKNDNKTAHAAFDAPRSGKKTEAPKAAPARMSMPPHAHEGRTTPVEIRIETAIETTNEKVRAVDFITSFLFMLV